MQLPPPRPIFHALDTLVNCTAPSATPPLSLDASAEKIVSDDSGGYFDQSSVVTSAPPPDPLCFEVASSYGPLVAGSYAKMSNALSSPSGADTINYGKIENGAICKSSNWSSPTELPPSV